MTATDFRIVLGQSDAVGASLWSTVDALTIRSHLFLNVSERQQKLPVGPSNFVAE
jgi:hypothetical protein